MLRAWTYISIAQGPPGDVIPTWGPKLPTPLSAASTAIPDLLLRLVRFGWPLVAPCRVANLGVDSRGLVTKRKHFTRKFFASLSCSISKSTREKRWEPPKTMLWSPPKPSCGHCRKPSRVHHCKNRLEGSVVSPFFRASFPQFDVHIVCHTVAVLVGRFVESGGHEGCNPIPQQNKTEKLVGTGGLGEARWRHMGQRRTIVYLQNAYFGNIFSGEYKGPCYNFNKRGPPAPIPNSSALGLSQPKLAVASGFKCPTPPWHVRCACHGGDLEAS